jgi:hypothetical protein
VARQEVGAPALLAAKHAQVVQRVHTCAQCQQAATSSTGKYNSISVSHQTYSVECCAGQERLPIMQAITGYKLGTNGISSSNTVLPLSRCILCSPNGSSAPFASNSQQISENRQQQQQCTILHRRIPCSHLAAAVLPGPPSHGPRRSCRSLCRGSSVQPHAPSWR